MTDQRSAGTRPETARAWDGLRWLREPTAWTLLALTAIILLVSACQLFRLAGARIATPAPHSAVASPTPAPAGISPVPAPFGISPAPAPVAGSPAPATVGPRSAPVSTFSLRASAVAPQFIDFAVQAMPVLAVILVTFCGGWTDRARQVGRTAAAVLAIAFTLGLISLAGAAGTHLRTGAWFILEGAGLGITAVALAFTAAVLWPRPVRSLAARFYDVHDDADGWDDSS